jgi:hypothetical protein
MIRQIDEDVERVARGKATDRLNRAAAGSFFVGVIFLVIFALYNFGR